MRKETETVGKVIIGIVIGLIIGLVVAAICFSKLDELELKREAKKRAADGGTSTAAPEGAERK